MPFAIDPAWEYWTPDPEVSEAVDLGYARAEGFVSLGVEERRLVRDAGLSGFRFGFGDPNGSPRLKLRRERIASPRTLEPKECEQCRVLFQPRRSTRRFCSRACKLLAQRKRRPKQTCSKCQRAFRPRWTGQGACGVACANGLRNQMRRRSDASLIRGMYLAGARLADIAAACCVSLPTVKRETRKLNPALRRASGRPKGKTLQEVE